MTVEREVTPNPRSSRQTTVGRSLRLTMNVERTLSERFYVSYGSGAVPRRFRLAATRL